VRRKQIKALLNVATVEERPLEKIGKNVEQQCKCDGFILKSHDFFRKYLFQRKSKFSPIGIN
jgi:hypothetical protein